MKDQFGGVTVESDEFGGIPVATDSFGGVALEDTATEHVFSQELGPRDISPPSLSWDKPARTPEELGARNMAAALPELNRRAALAPEERAREDADKQADEDASIEERLSPKGVFAYHLFKDAPAAVARSGRLALAGMSDAAAALNNRIFLHPEDQVPADSVARFIRNPTQPSPAEEGAEEMTGAGRFAQKALQGAVKVAPAIGASMALGGAGVPEAIASAAPFAFDEYGKLDPTGAALMAALPGIGKLGESGVAKFLEATPVDEWIAGGLSAKLGKPVAKEAVATWLKAGGNQVAANAALLASESKTILELPADQRGQALADMVAGNLAPAFLAFANTHEGISFEDAKGEQRPDTTSASQLQRPNELEQSPGAVEGTPSAPAASSPQVESKPLTTKKGSDADKAKPLANIGDALGDKVSELDALQRKLLEQGAKEPNASDEPQQTRQKPELTPEQSAPELARETETAQAPRDLPAEEIQAPDVGREQPPGETATKATQPDKIDEFLTRMIEATDLKGDRLMEGVTGAPVWLTQSAANGLLRVVRSTYRVSKNVAQTIETALDWLRQQKLEGYQEEEARRWVTDALQGKTKAPEPKPEAETPPNTETAPEPESVPMSPPEFSTWQEHKEAIQTAANELRDRIAQHQNSRELNLDKGEAYNAKNIAAAKYRTLERGLLQRQDYIEHLLTETHRLATEGGPEFERLRDELDRVPPKMVEAATQRLYADGRLPKPKVPEYGRTLDNLTDWLKEQKKDSPKQTLMERLQLARRWTEEKQAFKDTLAKVSTRLQAAGKAFVEQYKAPPIDTPVRSLFKAFKFADEYTGQEIRAFRNEIVRQVPSRVRRMAISVWIDAGGSPELLKFQADAVPDNYREIWQAAQRLTPGEKAIAKQIIANLERMKGDGLNAGLLQKAREDYGMPQVWKTMPETGGKIEGDGTKGNAANPTAVLDPRNPFFSFERTVPSYFDGIMAKGTPQSLDVADLMSHYQASFHKSLNSRAFIAQARNNLAADGSPLVKISGMAKEVPMKDGGRGYIVEQRSRSTSDTAPDGRPYLPLDHWALKDWKLVYKDAEGKPILVHGDFLIHPDHFEQFKNELGQSALREGKVGKMLRPIFESNAFLKSSKLAFAGFHMLTIAEHMASHLQSPFTNGFKIDLRDTKQRNLVLHGLELGMSGPQSQFMEGVMAGHSGLMKHVPGLGDFMAKSSDWMFKDWIPTIMMKVGLHALDRNMERYKGKLTEAQIYELTASQMNAGGGLLNYRQLGRNKTLMDLNRLVLLAPTFLEARARVVAQALKPYGHEQRRLLLVQAAGMFVAARLLNSLFDSDPHWEARNWFRVVINGRAYGLRTITGDVAHLVTDPESFAAGRLSPVMLLGHDVMTGRDLRTGAHINTYFDSKFPRMLEIGVRDVLSWLAPVGTEGLLPGAKGKETTMPSAAMTSIGIGSRKETKQSQVFDWARSFNRKGDAEAQRWQKQRDTEVHNESDYKVLDNLLDAGDYKAAVKEYQALLKRGHSEESVEKRFKGSENRPFTGTRERENAFYEGLTEHERKVYEQAMQERQQRVDAFYKMLDQLPQ